jgi:hypothetical protein
MTVAFKNKTPVVVPLAALRRAGSKSGQELEVKAAGGVITIVPKLPTSDDEYTPAQRRAIEELQARRGHWFWALNFMTKGIDPAPEGAGIDAARDAWLTWGRQNGFLK